MNRLATHPPERARQSRVLRGLAALAAVLCLAGQLSSLTHMLLVRHVTCPEHGELLHAGDDLASTGPEIDQPHRSTQPSPNASIEGEDGGETGHEHDRCFVLSQRRECIGLALDRGVEVAAAPSRALTSTPASDAGPARIPLFLLAPKSSPPAARV